MVSEFNIMRSLYMLEDSKEYHFPFAEFDTNNTAKPSTDKEETKSITTKQVEEEVKKEPKLLPGLANTKLFLSSLELPELINKPRFKNLFNTAVIGFFHGHHIKDNFTSILKDEARVFAELPVNFVGIKDEYKKKCYEKVETMAKACGLVKVLSPYDHHYLFRKF